MKLLKKFILLFLICETGLCYSKTFGTNDFAKIESFTDAMVKMCWMIQPYGSAERDEYLVGALLPFYITTTNTNGLVSQSVTNISFFPFEQSREIIMDGETNTFYKYWNDSVLYSCLDFVSLAMDWAGGYYDFLNTGSIYPLLYIDDDIDIPAHFSSGASYCPPHSTIFTDTGSSDLFVGKEIPFDFKYGGITNYNVMALKLYKMPIFDSNKDLFTSQRGHSGYAMFHNFANWGPLHYYQDNNNIVITNNFTNNISIGDVTISYYDGFDGAKYNPYVTATNLPFECSLRSASVDVNLSPSGGNNVVLTNLIAIRSVKQTNISALSTNNLIDVTASYSVIDNNYVTLQGYPYYSFIQCFSDGFPELRSCILDDFYIEITNSINALADNYTQAQLFYSPSYINYSYFTLGSDPYQINMISNVYYSYSTNIDFSSDGPVTSYSDATDLAYDLVSGNMTASLEFNNNNGFTKQFYISSKRVGDATSGSSKVSMKFWSPYMYVVKMIPPYDISLTNLFNNFEFDISCYSGVASNSAVFDSFGTGEEELHIYPLLTEANIDAGIWTNLTITNTIADYAWHEPTTFDALIHCKGNTGGTTNLTVNIQKNKFYYFFNRRDK